MNQMTNDNIKSALQAIGKHPGFTEVVDFECLDEDRGMYYIWLQFPNNLSIKVLETIRKNSFGKLEVIEA